MRIAVIGSSGRSGRAVVRAALARGHEVTATVRSPEKADVLGPADRRVRIVIAAVEDVDSLRRALAGADAVAFCVGPGKGHPSTVQSDGIATCLTALDGSSCQRLVALSASGLVAERGDDPVLRYLAKPILQRVLAELFADLAIMEERLVASDLDWTIIRPPRLREGTAKGRYRSGVGRGVAFGLSITYADLGTAFVDLIEDATTIRRAVTVAN